MRFSFFVRIVISQEAFCFTKSTGFLRIDFLVISSSSRDRFSSLELAFSQNFGLNELYRSGEYGCSASHEIFARQQANYSLSL